MTTDMSGKEERGVPLWWSLPEIVDIKIMRISYQGPKRRFFVSYLAKYTEAIEFLVKTTGPFPIRALSPVLYVGDVAVTENESVEELLYRFLAFEFDRLEEGALISLGWTDTPPYQRLKTVFRYKLPDDNQREK
jgi:hypothetical protein